MAQKLCEGMDVAMNIQHLKYFIAVGECLNFSEAAKTLFITQPSLSHVISKLENQIGAKLFIRNTKHVRLTQAGELLMPAAMDIVGKYESIIKELEKFSSQDKDTLKIGYVGTAFNRIFPWCIPVFQKEHPDTKVTLQRFDPGYFADAFDNDLIDIGFSHKIDAENARSLHYQKLFDVYLAVVVHKDHPLSRLDSVDLAALKTEPLIVPMESFSPNLHKKIMAVCAIHGFIPQISQRAQSIDVQFQMIDSKMGVAILPESCRYLNYPNVRIVRIRDNNDLNIEAGFVWKNKLKPRALELLELVNETISKTQDEQKE